VPKMKCRFYVTIFNNIKQFNSHAKFKENILENEIQKHLKLIGKVYKENVWIPHELLEENKKFVCQDGHEMKLQVGKQNRWRCYVKESRKEIGIRIGTWFEGTKIPFKTAIFFIYCWSYEMVSVDFCKRELEMNHNTVVDWGSYFREVCLFMEKKCQSIIGRKGFTVEVDETLFTRRKNHCGRMLTQQWCFGRICCETKECFVRPVPNRSSNTLIEVLRRRREYSQVAEPGYEHLKVNHKYNFVDQLTNAHTQNIKRVWRSVKARSRRQNKTCKSMPEGYMYEFTWRKKNKKEPFYSMLKDIKEFYCFLVKK
uniref:ISXO2-like transposase domain-containing protein n=1 Tax=Strongyloides stercoralis TaxID=6248 RepID=A0AAF5I4H8_STRER